MYKKVLPKYSQLEKAADVPSQERLRYATCYGSFEEGPNEVILLEDLNEPGFVMLDRFKPLTLECVKSILKNFALVHSLSYAFKHKEPELYEEYSNSLFDMWAAMESLENVHLFVKQTENAACGVLDSDVHKKAVQGALSESLRLIAKRSKSDRVAKHSVILQGDAWTNNIMFRFDGESLAESIMIDYQLSKPANPVSDILYMIFNCTDYESRKEHFYDWIDYYHAELDKALSNYGLKANYVYPRDQVDVDLRRYGKSNFGLSIMLAGILIMKSEDASAMKDAMASEDVKEMAKQRDLSVRDPETIALYKNKIEGLVASYLELGLL